MVGPAARQIRRGLAGSPDVWALFRQWRDAVRAQMMAHVEPELVPAEPAPDPETLWRPRMADHELHLHHVWMGDPGWPESWRTVGCKADYAVSGPPHTRWWNERPDGTAWRGVCYGCGAVFAPRTDELGALGDALDHTHPGWRSLPVFKRPARDRARLTPAESEQWATSIRKVLPAGWLESGGPLRTMRLPEFRLRCWPGAVPGGGWDVPGIVVPPDRERGDVALFTDGIDWNAKVFDPDTGEIRTAGEIRWRRRQRESS